MTDKEPAEVGDGAVDRPWMSRVFLTGIALLVVPVALTRLLVGSIDVASKKFYEETWVRDATHAIPAVPKTPGAIVLAVGASPLEWGFRPAEFDALVAQRGASVTSFNFGMPGMTPHYNRLLLDQLARAFDAESRKAKLTVLEFCFFQATTASLARTTPPSEQIAAALESERTIARTVLRTPEVGLREATYRFLYDGLNPSNLRYPISDALEREPSWWPGARSNAGSKSSLVDIVWRRPASDHWQAYRWSMTTRGSPDLVRADSLAAYEAVLRDIRPEDLAAEVDDLKTSDDLLGLHFSDALVDDFIAMCRVADRISEQKAIILSPIRPAIEALRAPDAIARRRAAIERIERACGQPVVDLSEGFTDADFSDPVHVNQTSGRTKYTAAMATLLAPRL